MVKDTVIITGGNRGIGKATALEFSKANFNLIITYNSDKQTAEETAEECKKLGAKEVLVLKLDVRSQEEIKEVFRKTIEKFGKINILINNAGVGNTKNLEDQSLEWIDEQIDVNLIGLIKVTKEALKVNPNKEDFVIINISSRLGKTVIPGTTVYCATKWGVRGFTKALAEERPNIKVFSVNPGSTATAMTGFEGIEPKKVGEIIFNAAKLKYKKESGSDIDVGDYLK